MKEILMPVLENYNLKNINVKIINSNKNKLILKKNNIVIAKMNKQEELPQFLQKLENKENFINQKQKELLNNCGLPIIKATSHCFTNNINTCCQFGNYARSYGIDYNEMPIINSEDAFEYRYGRKPNQTEQSNFCTTKNFCKEISDKFKDGSRILFTMKET